jgi:hypothetical protein
MQLKQINQPSFEDYLETLSTRARTIMYEARKAAAALLTETTRLERYITEQLATHGIITHSIAVR